MIPVAPPRGGWRPAYLALVLDDDHVLHLLAPLPISTRCGRVLDDRRHWRLTLRRGVHRGEICRRCWDDMIPPNLLRDDP